MPETPNDPAYVAIIDAQADEHVLQQRYEEVHARVARGDCPACGAHRCRCSCSLDEIEQALAEVY